MKRLVKNMGKGLWRMTGPIRRPLRRKFNAAINDLLTSALREHVSAPIHPRLDSLERGLNLARHEVQAQGVDANLTLDSLVREVTRLQMQLESLAFEIRARSNGADGLSIVGDVDDAEDYESGERMKVG